MIFLFCVAIVVSTLAIGYFIGRNSVPREIWLKMQVSGDGIHYTDFEGPFQVDQDSMSVIQFTTLPARHLRVVFNREF